MKFCAVFLPMLLLTKGGLVFPVWEQQNFPAADSWFLGFLVFDFDSMMRFPFSSEARKITGISYIRKHRCGFFLF